MTEPATALAPISLTHEMGVAEIVSRKRMMDQIFKELMKVNVHYGTIPGTPKPSLWQPGAELLGRTFALAPEYETSDLDGDSKRFRSTCKVRHIPSGLYLAESNRVASWYEPAFRWRKATKAEFEAAPVDARRAVDKSGPRGSYVMYQVESDPSEMENAIMARAEKRAHVAAIKTATAASDIFHELDPGPLTGEDDEQEPLKRPQKKAGAGRASGPPKTEEPPDDGAPPPEDPDGADPEPRAEGGSPIPEPAWQAIRDIWHTKGIISGAQVKRLFALAGKNGWKGDQVRDLVKEHLGVGLDDIPYGEVYDRVVGIFEGFAPEG